MEAGCTPNTLYTGPAAFTPVDPDTTTTWWLQTANQYAKERARLNYDAALEFSSSCTADSDCDAPQICTVLDYEDETVAPQ